MEVFRSVEQIDQCQVHLAMFEVTGVIRDMMIQHSYEMHNIL